MSQQYRRVNMAEVMKCVNVMTPGVWHDSDCIASRVTMDRRRVVFALLRAEQKGLISVDRPDYRMRKERNLYRRVERWRTAKRPPC